MTTKFITDMGRPIPFTLTGGPTEVLPRYGVWDTSSRGNPEVIDTGNSLEELQAKHGPGLPLEMIQSAPELAPRLRVRT